MANKDMTYIKPFLDSTRLAFVCHPGETLEEKLQEMNMRVKEFATRVSKPEKTIIAVLKGKSSVTPDMAVAFELVTKIPASMWLRLQKDYDEFQARKRREEYLAEGLTWVEKFPLDEIANFGWLSIPVDAQGNQKNVVDTLCSFFAVSSPKGWADLYLGQKLRVSFCGTTIEQCNPYALSAWLRQGEIQVADEILKTKYSSRRLRAVLDDVVRLRKSEDKDCRLKAASMLRQVGVLLIFTDTLSSAPVKGCTRYINGIPTIQLAKRFDSEDDFWRTFFHEIGHILLHGKKDIFIENVNYGDKDPKKEKEADDFAALWIRKSEP